MPTSLRPPPALLLEPLVRMALAEDIKHIDTPETGHGCLPAPVRYASPPVPRALRELMSRHVGLERNEAGLKEALTKIAQIERAGGYESSLLNMTTTARMVVVGALARRESRGGHCRSDYPATDPAGSRSFMTLAEADKIADLPVAPNAARVPV